MPSRPKRPCNRIGCRELTNERFCIVHKKTNQQEQDRSRGTSTTRGYNSRWRKARKIHLNEHPLCVHCQNEGRITAANEVDHIIPHKKDYDLFWDEGNWQSLCKSCHSKKTTTEDGGFNRPIVTISVK